MAHEYVYAPMLRAPRRNAGPEGCIRMEREDGRGPFGVLIYNRPLTKTEIEDWHLRTIDMPRVSYYVYGILANGNREFLLEWQKEMPGAYDAAVARADELGRTEEFADYVVQPV